jgi:hypothetical protein
MALTMWSAEVVCLREGYVTRRVLSRKPAKAQQGKPTRPKRSNTALAARYANSALSELQKLKSQVRELEEVPVKAEKASGMRPGAQQSDVRIDGAVRPASFRVDL